jgi:hypothetical protein
MVSAESLILNDGPLSSSGTPLRLTPDATLALYFSRQALALVARHKKKATPNPKNSMTTLAINVLLDAILDRVRDLQQLKQERATHDDRERAVYDRLIDMTQDAIDELNDAINLIEDT